MRSAAAAKRRSTHWTIISRIISPEIPAVVASQAMTSRSWQSRTKAMRTISPLQQVNSSIGTPADVRADGDDLAVVLACSPSAGIGLQKQSVLLHQAKDALGIDGLASGGSALALEERGDPPVAIGGPLVDEVAMSAIKSRSPARL